MAVGQFVPIKTAHAISELVFFAEFSRIDSESIGSS